MAASDVDVDSLELPTRVSNGINFPSFFQGEHLEEAFSFRPRDDHLILTTYPKSGTNWVSHIVLNLLHYDKLEGYIAKAHEDCIFVDKMGIKTVQPGSFLMTHLPFNINTFNPNAKYIIVLRNPRDVAVSYYHFSTQVATKFGDFPKDMYWFPRYAELFVRGEIWYGDYMEYHRDILEGLRKHGKPENILYVVYEKMKKDPRGELLRIANFVGDRAAEIIKDEEVVDTILKQTSVEFMRELGEKLLRENSGHSDTPPAVPDAIQFVRKGVVGDYVNHFTPEIAKMFDDYIASHPKNKEIMEFFEV